MPSHKYSDPRPTATFDTECYINYWSIGFLREDTGECVIIEKYDFDDGMPVDLDYDRIRRVLRHWRIVGFNSNRYDMCMIALAMTGASNAELKRASDMIIQGRMQPWEFMDEFKLKLPDFIDTIDLMEVSPGAAGEKNGKTTSEFVSLKMYGCRLHSSTIMDLPIDPSEWIDEEKRKVLRDYLPNDLKITLDKYNELRSQIEIRAVMSDRYGIDLRSKSDAQVAEAVLKYEVQRITGNKVYRSKEMPDSVEYEAPSYIKFHTPALQEVFEKIKATKFVIDRNGYCELPESLENADISFGPHAVFHMGLGGLHSQESNISHYSDDEYLIVDRDVRGYYPNMILRSGRWPAALGKHFQVIFKRIVDEREVAKANYKATKQKRYKDEAETGKIMSNGTFGKTGSFFSVLYAPEMLIQTTITGQLSILMLIEALEMRGIHVISANTDGIVTKVPRHRMADFHAIIFDWECDTDLQTEETIYRSTHSLSVNAYIAMSVDPKTGEVEAKRKGIYAPSGPGLPAASGMKKNPVGEIAIEAAVEFLRVGAPVEKTIRDCMDIRKFIVVRRVNNGCMVTDDKTGIETKAKALRWYHAVGVEGTLSSTTGACVAKSAGAKPTLTLPSEFPRDVDYDFYIREAYAILQDVGASNIDPAFIGRRGTILGRLEDEKTIHTVEVSTGATLCGKDRKRGIRDAWIEYGFVPAGMRHCKKCREAGGDL